MPASPLVLTRARRAYDVLRHAAHHGWVRAAYFLTLAVAALWPALGTTGFINIYQDAQQHSLFEEAARQAVVRFHELPLWDPYYCGGIYGLGTPSARFASPPFLLTLLFGTLRGSALSAVLMTVVGLEGTFRYLRQKGGGSLGAMTAAPVFALSGVFAHATMVAWTNFFGFELVPWTLLGVRMALGGSRRGVALASLSVGWMIGFGGTYTAPLTALAAGVEVVAFVIRRARRPGRGFTFARVVVMGLVVVLLAAAVSMVRLWPVAETLSASPRLLGGRPGAAPLWIWHHLVGESSNHFEKGDFFVGLPVIPVVLLGVGRRRAWPSVVATGLWLWFALGYKVDLSIFGALRTVPPYTMLRSPERFLTFVALAAASLAAIGVRRQEAVARRRPRLLPILLIAEALLVVDAGLLVHLGWMKANARRMEPAPPTLDREFRQDRGNRWIAAYYPWMSRGTLTCFDDYDIAQSPELRGDLPSEEYLKDKDAGTVARAGWSPEAIDLDVTLTRPARVYVNQNWHPGWRSNVGEVVSEDGLLGVDLPAGHHALHLFFRPRSAVGGGVTTLLGLVALGILLVRARRGDGVASWGALGETLVVAAVPLAATAWMAHALHEPPRPPAPLLTPTGEPMVVDAVPDDATPLGVHWAEGITLEAAHLEVEPADESHGPFVTVELDWRFDRPLPPGLGVFLQFERQGGHFNTDHVLLSGAVTPEDAPLHAILRDVSDPIAVQETKTATSWRAWAGVWRARRDMSRLEIVNKGTASVGSNRVLLGTFVVGPSDKPPEKPTDKE